MAYLSFNRLFPLWAILISFAALLWPQWFSQQQTLIVPMLSLVMFIMGLTLTPADFKRIIERPGPVFIGVLLQFTIMPLSAFLLARLLQLSTELTAGLVLVGSCAGGTASNVICYLARGDVALSISMTLTSTLLGVIATPFLCSLYLATTIDVNTLGMLQDIAQIVLLPVAGGCLLNRFLRRIITRIETLLPSVSMCIILLIIAIIVALNAERMLQIGLLTLIAVIAHNSIGLGGGYLLSRLLGLNRIQARTIAIEVGMQNSGLGVALALEYFSVAAALPGAFFSVWHNISGSILAAYWRGRKNPASDSSQQN